MTTSLSPRLLERLNAYWRAANYLKVGQLYLHKAVQAVLVAGWHPQSHRCGNAGLDQRRGRTRVLAPARVRHRLRQPDLIVACVVGDDEAETGALAASWHSKKFLDPEREGAMLSILHLNGYKIANPTVFARNQH